MSFHPNDVARRARMSSLALGLGFVLLVGAFFKTQVIQNKQYVMQSEENRLRPIPLPAPRGIIYDRHGQVIAENLPAYSVSITAPSVDSLRSALAQLAPTLQLGQNDINLAIRRYRRAPTRPTVILADASIDIVSVLEEHRLDFPRLIIQSVPKRYYPDGPIVASFVGYTGEITESELNDPKYTSYKPGQSVGKAGLEKQYENILHGREGVRFDEVDARGRPVRGEGPRPDLTAEGAPPLYTNIDLDLQKFTSGIFADSLQGGAIAIDPSTGEVLALYSAPSWDPNKFTGGIPVEYYKKLLDDKRRPLVNKVIQGRYPPGSTFKLATSVIALENGLVTPKDHMPVPCTGGYQYGNRYFRCWEKKGHGSLSLEDAIKHSCDTYFYQLGLKIGLSRLIAGGISLTMRDRSGIDLPEENQPYWPYATEYYDKKYGPRNWSNAETLNLAIGQGANSQTVVNMAKLYTALASGGMASRPEIAHLVAQRKPIYKLSPDLQTTLLNGLKAVTEAGGTAAASALSGTTAGGEQMKLAGKTGTAQNPGGADHGWFVGFAPADNPKIVVAVLLEFGLHGSRAAHIASAIISHYLKITPIQATMDEG
ncbi:MAG: penicillin-binding protein 2 [Gemmatimonadetes bacterium]|nr:MAG: penicillin-binding protein 2 [Gemmatimonadota bacterium]PYO76897.1 MAG: penicillin-binding protein 2 [Gemmatimonadota bacterium]